MVRIACLHTADSNAAVFDAALLSAGVSDVELRHAIRPDLLQAAEAAGGMTPDISADTVSALLQLVDGADAVLLTCSTLGPAAKSAAAGTTVPVLRVDAALAAEAVRDGGPVVVLCAVSTTIEPTRHLFEAAAAETGAQVRVQWVDGAWDAYRAGRPAEYHRLIAAAASRAGREPGVRVVLAQASMAGACAGQADGLTPLESPAAGLRAAIAAARG